MSRKTTAVVDDNFRGVDAPIAQLRTDDFSTRVCAANSGFLEPDSLQ
jgi:hypothetical protein